MVINKHIIWNTFASNRKTIYFIKKAFLCIYKWLQWKSEHHEVITFVSYRKLILRKKIKKQKLQQGFRNTTPVTKLFSASCLYIFSHNAQVPLLVKRIKHQATDLCSYFMVFLANGTIDNFFPYSFLYFYQVINISTFKISKKLFLNMWFPLNHQSLLWIAIACCCSTWKLAIAWGQFSPQNFLFHTLHYRGLWGGKCPPHLSLKLFLLHTPITAHTISLFHPFSFSLSVCAQLCPTLQPYRL